MVCQTRLENGFLLLVQSFIIELLFIFAMNGMTGPSFNGIIMSEEIRQAERPGCLPKRSWKVKRLERKSTAMFNIAKIIMLGEMSVTKIFADLYDLVMAPLEKRGISRIRKKLISGVEGQVLELGGGTGANIPFYSSKKIASLSIIEPNPHMLAIARDKARNIHFPIEFYEGVGESLPFVDNQFDHVVATLVLCSVDDPEKVFQEMKRVCKPEGKIILFEHVRTSSSTLAFLQDILTPAWKRLCDGCHLNRDTARLMKESGIDVILEKKHLQGIFIEIIGVNQK